MQILFDGKSGKNPPFSVLIGGIWTTFPLFSMSHFYAFNPKWPFYNNFMQILFGGKSGKNPPFSVLIGGKWKNFPLFSI